MFGFQLKNLNYAILVLYAVIPFYMVKNWKQKGGCDNSCVTVPLFRINGVQKEINL